MIRKIFQKNIKFINLDDKVCYKVANRLITSINSILLLLNLFKKTDSKNSLVVSFQSHILPIIFSRLFRRKIVIRN